MKKFCNHTIPYDDNNITYNVSYLSKYLHFNTFRTCNFIFAFKLLTEYKKICILESDILILKNIDDIFELNAPSILIFKKKEEYNILENYRLNKKKVNFEDFNINGGVMLIKPSLSKYNQYLKNLKKVIEKGYDYPNEALFLLTNNYIYNMPFKFNGTQYQLDTVGKKYEINLKEYLTTIHFNSNEYKHLDIIRDGYLNKTQNMILYYFINIFKKKYYDKYSKKISFIIKKL